MAKGQCPMAGGIVELQGQHQRGCGHHPTGHHTHSARGGQNYDLTGQREPFSWQAPLWVCYGAPITASQMAVVMQHRRAGSESRTDRPSQALKIHPIEQGK